MAETLRERAIAWLKTQPGQKARMYELAKALKVEQPYLASAIKTAIKYEQLVKRPVTGGGAEVTLIGDGVGKPEPRRGDAARAQRALNRQAAKAAVAGPKATIPGVVAGIIQGFGENGCTIEDIAKTIKANFPQWKPVSASPAVSHLVRIGVVREEHNFGVRRLHFKRAFDYKKDQAKIAAINRAYILRKAGEKNELRAVNGSGAKILIAVGEKHTEAMTIEDARSLYEQLKVLFA